jgi:pyrroline-5-carboxylate reductase
MTHPTIGFIGAGNMARSLASGLLANGWERDRLALSDVDPEQRRGVETGLGLAALADNRALAERAELLVLAVKPQVLRAVAAEIAPAVQARRPLVLSIAAGVRLADLERWLGGNLALVRAMPNTPALIGSGASGLYANPRVNEAERELAEAVLRAVGVTVWLADEDLLDVVTALSGSGPAYFFLFMEALERAARRHGLDQATARLLTLQTAFGAARMALEVGEEPARLRARVTSPGGTTERALQAFEQGDFGALVERAIEAALARSRELAKILGEGDG